MLAVIKGDIINEFILMGTATELYLGYCSRVGSVLRCIFHLIVQYRFSI